MKNDEAWEAFKALSQEDVFAGLSLDRNPVYQLGFIASYLLRVESWAKSASDALLASQEPALAASVASAHKLVNERLPRTARMLANAIEKRVTSSLVDTGNGISPKSIDRDPAEDCLQRQQQINRETLSALSEADSLSDRAEAISDWGRETAENLENCLNDAFSQFDNAKP